MKHYSVGYAFNQRMTQVIMIRKNRPNWQAGKLNGIGGHIETGESPREAMVREFEEECGIEWKEWYPFASMHKDEEHSINFFTAVLPDHVFSTAKTTTDEEVDFYVYDTLIRKDSETINNTKFMLPMAYDFLRTQTEDRLFRSIEQI